MKRRRQRNLKRHKDEGQSSDSHQNTEKTSYPDIIKLNENFERFYKLQNIVPEGEWDVFMDTLRQNLPSTFRITGYKNEAKVLLNIIESDFFAKLTGGSNADDRDFEMFSLPWYPDKLAWQLNLSRKAIRKTEAYERLHNFLISETDTGNISRQEAVSMIPPLVLDVQPHHKILDMCAAPGSKTAQLIEMLHSDAKIVPDGMIVANDVVNKRCYMLVHQAKRLQSPCLLITNHDAGAMPHIHLPDQKQLKYDRILCDVPCSGDGTIRKNIDIWVKWNVANCLNYHCIQIRILKRGLELLEIGGKLVYSTCSLCPLEDESVVHHMLSLCKDSVVLVDIKDRLPGLKYMPGLSHWTITNRELQVIASPAEIPEKNKSAIKASMFPPNPEEASKYNLHKCMRILPHHQNTGGFFVAVLQKVAPLPWEIKSEFPDKSEAPVFRPPPKKKKKMMGYKEDPYLFLTKEEKLWPSLKSSYSITDDFDNTLLLTRCKEGKKRTLYFTSSLVRDLINCNADKLKIINTGIKLFCRCDNKKATSTEYRLTQEGLLYILPYLKNRVVQVEKSDIVYILTTNFPDIKDLSDRAKEGLKDYDNGSLALICEEEHDALSGGKLAIGVCAWKGLNSLRAYVAKNERLHFMRLCGVDTDRFENKKFKLSDDINGKDKESISFEEGQQHTDEVLDIKEEVAS